MEIADRLYGVDDGRARRVEAHFHPVELVVAMPPTWQPADPKPAYVFLLAAASERPGPV